MHDKYVIRAGCCLVLSVRVVIQEFFAMVSKVLIVCAFLLYELSGASRNDGRGGAMEAGGVGGVLRNHIYTSGVRQQNSTNELQVSVVPVRRIRSDDSHRSSVVSGPSNTFGVVSIIRLLYTKEDYATSCAVRVESRLRTWRHKVDQPANVHCVEAVFNSDDDDT